MASHIQLRKGDIFRQPADLIVIPCSTAGTVTLMVARSLAGANISMPQRMMDYGDVEFSLFEGASNIATYVAYAASVEGGVGSDERTITKIAKKIASFAAKKPEVRDVSLPLLGAGAGGLSAEQSAQALVDGLESVESDGKVFNIFVLEAKRYVNLTRRLPRDVSRRPKQAGHDRPETDEAAPPREPVRVFISYTRTSTEHEEWVRSIATFLRQNGVDARLDLWHLRRGMDLPQWMSNEIDLADRVLIMCNEDYARRADGRLGGVGWEIRLVQGDLLQSQTSNPKKYIPVVRGEMSDEAMPRFLKGVYGIVWREDSGSCRQELLRELYGVFEEAPPLGSPPRYVLRQYAD